MNSILSAQGDDTAAAKQSLRKKMRHLRRQILPENARDAALRAAGNLLQIKELDGVTTVGLYTSVDQELATQHAARQLRQQGIRLAYPRIIPGHRALAFHRVDDPAELVPGTYGIPEPPATAEPVRLDDIGLFVVPGLAFDRQGRRLGSGKGCYDATLTHCPAIRVGFAFDQQLVDEVPSTNHDLVMNLLVTESAIIYIGAQDTRAQHPLAG
jgi:5-formyltetrahydrofolate cyclo-ligase